MSCIKTIIAFICFFIATHLYAQNDQPQTVNATHADTSLRIKQLDTTAVSKKNAVKDTLAKKKHDPAKATRRSAIIPGWGQAYNHQYWKIPIVYGALAIPAATFVYNNKWYQKTKLAYEIVVDTQTNRYNEIDPRLIVKETGQPLDAQSLQFYRNEFRKNRDYSVLFFLIAWGVNIVDATVSGHLKDFDVSDNLSMHLQPDYNPATKKFNLGFAFNFKNPQRKPLPSF
jgi:hypothetical protein